MIENVTPFDYVTEMVIEFFQLSIYALYALYAVQYIPLTKRRFIISLSLHTGKTMAYILASNH